MHDRSFHRTFSILPYVWNIKRIQSAFFSFILIKLWIFNNGCPGLCQHRPKYPLKYYFKDPKFLKMKWKTTCIYLGFLIPNIVWQILKHFAKLFYNISLRMKSIVPLKISFEYVLYFTLLKYFSILYGTILWLRE